jgi:hypothetical protein
MKPLQSEKQKTTRWISDILLYLNFFLNFHNTSCPQRLETGTKIRRSKTGSWHTYERGAEFQAQPRTSWLIAASDRSRSSELGVRDEENRRGSEKRSLATPWRETDEESRTNAACFVGAGIPSAGAVVRLGSLPDSIQERPSDWANWACYLVGPRVGRMDVAWIRFLLTVLYFFHIYTDYIQYTLSFFQKLGIHLNTLKLKGLHSCTRVY